jgi:hypothetical protein
MTFNFFTGALTRYYLHNWQADTTNAPNNPAAVAEIQQTVTAWQQELSANMRTHAKQTLQWREGASLPFATHEMSWRGYGALLLWALYHEQNLMLPQFVDDNWQQNPAYELAQSEAYHSQMTALTTECELWLPANFSFSFLYANPNHDEIVMGSTMQLSENLNLLNQNTWRADAKTIATWAQKPPENLLLNDNAQYCFAILQPLVAFANEHKLPLLLDY